MILIYADEAGINFQKKDGFFVDGPYILWCGMFVPESKYFHLERMFYDLTKRFLGVKDWGKIELHATDIWHRSGHFSGLTETKARLYFNELLQLLAKLQIQAAVSLEQKKPNRITDASTARQHHNCLFSFLINLEHRLSRIGETGLLIADELSRRDTQRSGSAEAEPRTMLEQLFFERVRWRYSPGTKDSETIKPKYTFEANSCFLLDQPHHVRSRDSLFIQIADNLTFVIRRVFTHAFLTYSKSTIKADAKKVPVTPENFGFYSRNIFLSWYNYKLKDVSMNPSDVPIHDGAGGYVSPQYIESMKYDGK